MATRCMIGIKTEEHKIRAIYCHYDGYPEHTGALLQKFYNTPEKINELIDLGDISQLGERLAPEKEFDEPFYTHRGTDLVKHSFETPQKGVTIAYHRDNGEKLSKKTFMFESQFFNKKHGVDFFYLFDDGRWHMKHDLY